MPLLAPPTRGFADMQRTINYDSGVLFSESGFALAAPHSTPVIDVSRYAYVAGFDSITVGQAQVTFNWYVDSATFISAGQRSFIFDGANIGTPAQYRIPNLGPFLIITWSPLAAGPTHSAQIFGTNRFHPCELIPQHPMIIDQQSAAIGASATVSVYPLDYYAGPIQVFAQCSQAFSVQLKTLQTTLAYDPSHNLNNQVAATPVNFNAITAPGAWRFDIVNGAASAGTFFLTVVPSLTGSS